jgi:hypothetical protein
MKDHISVDLNEVSAAINRMRARSISEAFTSDIIREYMGGFVSNKGVKVYLSWNAQFGQIISSHAATLSISELKSNHPVVDDLNHDTVSSLWKL